MNSSPDESSIPYQAPIIAATLSAIAYNNGATSISASLKNSLPGWSLAWCPKNEVNGNYAYIAYNQQSLLYAVAIRGSILSFTWAAFDDWFEQDLNVLLQNDWTYPTSVTSAQQKISRGAHDGLADLMALVSTDPSTGKKTRMLDFLMQTAVTTNALILVTGHSLGAGLSTVFAPWLYYQIKSAKKQVPPMQVMTFAAPAIGNAPFAAAYDTTFPRSQRYYNVLDIVPMASASIKQMGTLYPGLAASSIGVTYKGFGVTLQGVIDTFADGVKCSEDLYGSIYTQTNKTSGSFALNTSGQLCPWTGIDKLEQWFDQAGKQHSITNAYLPFLRGQALVCS
jgi:hypothetical protein